MTCRHCGAALAADDRFCALCGKGTDEEPETNTFRLDLSKPSAATVSSGGPVVATILARARSLWNQRRPVVIAIAAVAALVMAIAIGSAVSAGRGPTAAGTDGSGSGSEAGASSAPEGTSLVTETPSPTPEVIAPHYSPSGSFVGADPANFVVPGWDGIVFMSPSLNVGCAIAPEPEGYWGCAINEHHWSFPATSADDPCFGIAGACGNGIEATGLEITHARVDSQSTSPASRALASGYDGATPVQVLQYGESLSYGSITCYAESLGISCQNAVSGHGFTIARDRNDVY